MRKPIPTIGEEVAALKERLQHEHDGHKKPRLQMLYLLASGQAHERQAAARLLGVHRNTVGRWLALYAAGGLAGDLCPPRHTRLARARRARQPRGGAPPPARLRFL